MMKHGTPRRYYEVMDRARHITMFHAEQGQFHASYAVTDEFMQSTIMKKKDLDAMVRDQLDRYLNDAIEAEKVWEREVAKYANPLEFSELGKTIWSAAEIAADFMPVTSELLEDEAAITAYINKRLREQIKDVTSRALGYEESNESQ